MTPPAPCLALTACATFVDDLSLLRVVPDIPTVVTQRQSDIDARLHRAQYLKIHLTPAKADLVHIIRLMSSRTTPDDAPPLWSDHP